ncbi:MAG: 3-phosphoshikimate 1-carboxyvinyltransferase [Clostridia bacterium]|nr:3-phosphoshikimate 1-carboxyvinyltransferase [Clostridia bacterium]
MTVKINKATARGRVQAPPSKSMAHRYLICGALSGGSVIKGIAFSKDIEATLGCLKALGADITVSEDTVNIGGLDVKKAVASNRLFCNESGSTLRFLIPVCLLFNQKITLCGSERLFSRSLSVYEQLCREQGLYFVQGKESVTLKGRLSSGKYSVRGDISSQFISGLMFALSLLEGDSEINITGKLESASYLGLTIKALADFGVRISRINENTIFIKGSQSYKKREVSVEGDCSNAAFLEAFNLFGGNVAVKGISPKTAQGDRVYGELFAALCEGKPTVDISDCPDLGPVLMAVAAAKNGAVFTGTRRLKIKESDRAEAMKAELAKFGCKVLVEENTVTVEGGIRPPKLPLFGHNDHRIVMSLAVLCSITGGTVVGAQAVEKSFPDFFEVVNHLGIKTEEID